MKPGSIVPTISHVHRAEKPECRSNPRVVGHFIRPNEKEFQLPEVILVFGIKEIMEHAQKLQSSITDLQAKLAEKTVTGSSGGDMVVAEVDGAQEVRSIRIEKGLLDSGDVEMLQELIVAAVNDALRKSKDMVAEEVSKLTGGIRLPGIG